MKPQKAGPWLWIVQSVASLLLLLASYAKLSAQPEAVAVFESLAMESTGRILIGLLEGGAALLLMSPYGVLGAALSAAIMLGALIAHCTHLGLLFGQQGAGMLACWLVITVCSLTVLHYKRHHLPLLGGTLS